MALLLRKTTVNFSVWHCGVFGGQKGTVVDFLAFWHFSLLSSSFPLLNRVYILHIMAAREVKLLKKFWTVWLVSLCQSRSTLLRPHTVKKLIRFIQNFKIKLQELMRYLMLVFLNSAVKTCLNMNDKMHFKNWFKMEEKRRYILVLMSRDFFFSTSPAWHSLSVCCSSRC